MNKRPTTPAVKKAVFSRKLLHESRFQSAMKRDGPSLPSIVKKMIENRADRVIASSNLYCFADATWFDVIQIPTNNFFLFVAQDNLSKISVGPHLAHEIQ